MREGGDCYLLIFKIFQLNIRLVKGGKDFIKVKVKVYHSLSHLLTVTGVQLKYLVFSYLSLNLLFWCLALK